MFDGSLRHEEKRKNVRTKRSLKLFGRDFLDRIVQMLLRCIIDQNVDPTAPLLSLCDCLPAKCFITDIASNEQTVGSLFFYKPLSFFRVFVLLQIDDRYICAFFGKCDRDRATNSAVSASDDGDFTSQFPAGALIFVNRLLRRCHLVFATGLPLLMLGRLKL